MASILRDRIVNRYLEIISNPVTVPPGVDANDVNIHIVALTPATLHQLQAEVGTVNTLTATTATVTTSLTTTTCGSKKLVLS